MRYEETKYGFNYGALDIERACSDEKKGWIVITLRTKKQSIQVYVTRSGKIRLHDQHGKELKALRYNTVNTTAAGLKDSADVIKIKNKKIK